MKKPTTKETVVLVIAILLLIITAYIEWSLWTWIGLTGFVLLVVGWALKK